MLPKQLSKNKGRFSQDVASQLRHFGNNYWQLVEHLCASGHVNYAIHVCEVYLNAVNEIKSDADSNNDIMTGLRRFIEYLKSSVSFTAPAAFTLSNNTAKVLRHLALRNVAPLDANLSLVYSLPDIIKLAIEASIFFDYDLVIARQNELLALFNAPKPQSIPARCQRGTTPANPYVKPDYAGNNAPNAIIKGHTGYTVTGKNAKLANFRISHVWGQASNPGFFTSLWNIVLVPAWANYLMDLQTPPAGSLASQMQNTIKAICDRLYGMASLNLSGLNIASTPSYDLREVLPGGYAINIICDRGSHKLGSIVKQVV